MRERWRHPMTLVAWTVAGLAALAAGYGAVWVLLPAPAVTEAVATPTPDVEEAEGPGPIVVNATGDVNLDPTQLRLLADGAAAPWTGVRDLFVTDDLTIVNLECTASRLGEAVDKQFNFRCDVDALPAMREAGVEVANLANNHSGDYGIHAKLDSRSNVTRAGMAAVGVGSDALDATTPAIFELQGRRVAVLGFGGVVPTPDWLAGPSSPGQATGYDASAMAEAVGRAKAIADLVLVTVHWGAELDTEPRADQVTKAQAMIDAGADAIFGHHAHRLQPLEWYQGRPIFYGLGNFVWPAWGPGAVSGIAHVAFHPDGRIEACLLPVTIRGGRPTPDGPRACG